MNTPVYDQEWDDDDEVFHEMYHVQSSYDDKIIITYNRPINNYNNKSIFALIPIEDGHDGNPKHKRTRRKFHETRKSFLKTLKREYPKNFGTIS